MILVLVELGGGLALFLGLFTRLFAVPLAFSMLVTTLAVHLPNGFYASSGEVQFTLLLLTVAWVALALMAPGEASLDHVLARLGVPPLTGEENRAEISARGTATGGEYSRVPHRVGSWDEEQRSYPYSRGR